MKPVVYDAGVLIAADRSDRRTWADHKVRLELGLAPLVPATVLAQVSRSARQVQLRRLLAGCEIVGFSEAAAHRAGALLGESKTTDVVDACVVELAIERGGNVITSDGKDIGRLVAATRKRVEIIAV
jgi:predicted nucleic acid-binding protein